MEAGGAEGILLVEDDPVDAQAVRRACRRAGVERPITVMRDGRQALAHLRGEAGADSRAGECPGLILLDLNLPLMSGLELLEALKADPALRRIPVVVLSTSGYAADVAGSFDRGAAGYVVKPLEFDAFVRAMQTIDRYWSLSEPFPDALRGGPGVQGAPGA